MKAIITLIVSLLLTINVVHSMAQNILPVEETTEVTTITNTDSSQIVSVEKTILDEEAAKDKDKKKDKIDLNDNFFYSLLINILALIILIGLIYYPSSKRFDILFTFILFNIAIFLLTFLLNEIKISMGAAFGLFAVFSMLRYRTEGISMKDMTYLFLVIAMGLMNAIGLEYHEMAIINGIIILITFILDGNIIFKKKYTKKVLYENIELIKPEFYNQMLEDLRKRTGLDIYKAQVLKIDFLKDAAYLEIFYRDPNGNNHK